MTLKHRLQNVAALLVGGGGTTFGLQKQCRWTVSTACPLGQHCLWIVAVLCPQHCKIAFKMAVLLLPHCMWTADVALASGYCVALWQHHCSVLLHVVP